ncbi:MAG: EamA family transporter RarD [Phycisphaerales bacterium]|nr:EamA family transporter RarD [Phycisphaerales bacterium]
MDRQTTGVLLALGAYGWWGAVTPVYYYALQGVNVFELIAWRVVAGLPVMLLILGATGRLTAFKAVFARPRVLLMLVTSALLIGINWFVFIWSVDTDRLAESSLGYYINPLVSVALGMLVLGERMRPAQWVAIAIATVGVVISALAIDGIPWISLSLAGSFALYGLVRKQVDADAPTGLAIEMLLFLPFMLVILGLVHTGDGTAFASGSPWLITMLLLGGPVTIVPLLLFTGGARRLRLATVGLLQYIAPTGQLLLAVLAYGEAFNTERLVAFILIWAAVITYSVDSFRASRNQKSLPTGNRPGFQ